MLRNVSKHFTPSTGIALIALVFALTGGAFAATGSGSGSATGGGSGATGRALALSAKAKPKPKSKTGPRGPAGPAGKAGAPGPAGAVGPAGPGGAQGAQGPAGAKGETGAAGGAGANGENVTSKTVPTSSEKCEHQGGSEFKAASGIAYACNGSPWTAGGTLPSGKTETGSWIAQPAPGKEEYTAISFAIPLAAGLTSAQTHFAPDPECPGTAKEPKANPGSLCVYITLKEGAEVGGSGGILNLGELGAGAGTTGAAIKVNGEASASEPPLAFGTWAVTAE
jgi:Collagen triple helix repeat (20 copies)